MLGGEMNKRQLTAREEVRLWKATWNELRGYHLRRMGELVMRKASLTRLNVMRPMPNDVPQLIHQGSMIKQCTLTLNEMDSVKERMWHRRELAPHQSAKLQVEIEKEK